MVVELDVELVDVPVEKVTVPLTVLSSSVEFKLKVKALGSGLKYIRPVRYLKLKVRSRLITSNFVKGNIIYLKRLWAIYFENSTPLSCILNQTSTTT